MKRWNRFKYDPKDKKGNLDVSTDYDTGQLIQLWKCCMAFPNSITNHVCWYSSVLGSWPKHKKLADVQLFTFYMFASMNQLFAGFQSFICHVSHKICHNMNKTKQ